MEKQTAVNWLVEQVNSDCLNSSFIRPELIEKAKEMEKEQLKKYAEFCVRCDREGLKLIHFNDYIKL
jgi:coenzyme F420-reducing hydrogenase beta subunit